MRNLVQMLGRLGIRRKYLVLLLLRSPFDALRAGMLAGLMKEIFACLEARENAQLLPICISYGLICAVLFFYNGTIWSIYAAFAAKLEVQLYECLTKRLLLQSFRSVERSGSGEGLTRLNSDIQGAIAMMNAPGNLPHAVVAMLSTVCSSWLMFDGSPILIGITWGFILPHLLLNYRLVLRRMRDWKERAQKTMSENMAALSPLITEAETIVLYDAGSLLLKKYEESSRRLWKVNMRIHMRYMYSDVIMRLFGSVGYLALLAMGGWLISQGRMQFSDIAYASQVRGAILSGVFMGINCWNNVEANAVCVKRINETLGGAYEE